MARRARSRLDNVLDAWACWLAQGEGAQLIGSSQLGRLMDGALPGSGGSADVVCMAAFPIEERVEAAVIGIAREDLLTADVLRLEYNAAFEQVCDRRGIARYEPSRAEQTHKALLLDVSVRTYKRRLASARELIEQRVLS